jgi:hypothetical protein
VESPLYKHLSALFQERKVGISFLSPELLRKICFVNLVSVLI